VDTMYRDESDIINCFKEAHSYKSLMVSSGNIVLYV